MSNSLIKVVHKNSMKRRETMNEQLKIALFGATGKTGIYYLEMALDKGTFRVGNLILPGIFRSQYSRFCKRPKEAPKDGFETKA